MIIKNKEEIGTDGYDAKESLFIINSRIIPYLKTFF